LGRGRVANARMPDGSEFQTAGAATLKPREVKAVRTRGTESRLVLKIAAKISQENWGQFAMDINYPHFIF